MISQPGDKLVKAELVGFVERGEKSVGLLHSRPYADAGKEPQNAVTSIRSSVSSRFVHALRLLGGRGHVFASKNGSRPKGSLGFSDEIKGLDVVHP